MKLAALIIIFGFSLNVSFGQETKTNKINPLVDIGIEYLVPTKTNRQIETTSMNFLYGWKRYNRFPFTFQFGLTATYAWGKITQLDSSLIEVTTENKALGIGPVFVSEVQLLSFKNLAVSPYISGGIILYNKDFPYDGDIYNFMWRMGGIIHYNLNNNMTLKFTGKWMHVSNGQRINPMNPSYEGAGIEISISKTIDL